MVLFTVAVIELSSRKQVAWRILATRHDLARKLSQMLRTVVPFTSMFTGARSIRPANGHIVFVFTNNLQQMAVIGLDRFSTCCPFPIELLKVATMISPSHKTCTAFMETSALTFLEGSHTRAKCEIKIIILVTDHANDGILAHVYAN